MEGRIGPAWTFWTEPSRAGTGRAYSSPGPRGGTFVDGRPSVMTDTAVHKPIDFHCPIQIAKTGKRPMAKKTNGVNKSEEVRQLLKANPQIGSQEVVANLAEKGIKVSAGLFYFVKGKM